MREQLMGEVRKEWGGGGDETEAHLLQEGVPGRGVPIVGLAWWLPGPFFYYFSPKHSLTFEDLMCLAVLN